METDGQKTYILDSAPAVLPTPGKYWALWQRVEQCQPGLNRHALTQKAIGDHPKPQDMTGAELQKMIDVFSAILRQSAQSQAGADDANQPAPLTA
jgi:hypothetical protein